MIRAIKMQDDAITATFQTRKLLNAGIAEVPDFRFADNVVRTIPNDLQNENPITRR